MAKRGRKPLSMPTVEWKCRIPADIAVQIDMIQFDPVKGQVEYGARSLLVTSLLRAYLSDRVKRVDTLTKSPDNCIPNPDKVLAQ